MSVITMMSIVVGVLAVLALVWAFRVTYLREGFAELIRRRKMTARISSMGDLIDSGNYVRVALTLERSQIFYENSYLHGRLELDKLDEIEYDSEQRTGRSILRVRAHGQTFEFALDLPSAQQWEALLPPRRFGEGSPLTRSGFFPPHLARGRA
jgi:hypothetical protein